MGALVGLGVTEELASVEGSWALTNRWRGLLRGVMTRDVEGAAWSTAGTPSLIAGVVDLCNKFL